MAIDNKLKTAKTKMFYNLILAVVVALSAFSAFEWGYYPYIENLLIPIIVILLSAYLFMMILKLHYFFIEVKGSKIIIRYYNANSLFRKYKVIEVPKNAFYDYEIERAFMGIKKTIYFSVKTKTGIFKFQPISLSLLCNEKISQIEFLLDDLKTKKD